MNELITIVSVLGGMAAGATSGFLLAGGKENMKIEDFEEKAEKKLEKVSEEGRKIIEEAGEKTERFKQRSIETEQYKKDQFERIDKLIASKEDQILNKVQQNEEIKKKLSEQTEYIEKVKTLNESGKTRMAESLCTRAGTTMDKAKEDMLAAMQRELTLWNSDRIKKQEQFLEDEKNRISKNMITEAIQRFSGATASEKGPLAIIVERDEYKARIIGKGAGVLTVLQEETECEIIFNDAPQTILVSSHDLVKKHIGREAVVKLLKDKNVTEQKVREVVEKEKANLEKLLVDTGKDIVSRLEMKKEYSEEFYKLLGRLRFRSSYGQNILKHSYEVGFLTLMLGSELGVNIKTCKVGGFLHDLGKAVDHELGEPHDVLTKKLMEEYEFSPEEIHAAWTHHDSETPATPEAMLVKAADAISAGRPGARQETLEKFLEHVRMIEGVANSYEGVEKSFAISAGRELRVLVQPKVLDDDMLPELVERIVEEIEEEKSYPGRVKVKVIRRTTSVEHTKKK